MGPERARYFAPVSLGRPTHDCLVSRCTKDSTRLAWKNRSFFTRSTWTGPRWRLRLWPALTKVHAYTELLLPTLVNVVGNKFTGMVWIGFATWWIPSGCIVVPPTLLTIDALLGNFLEDKVLDAWSVEVFRYTFIQRDEEVVRAWRSVTSIGDHACSDLSGERSVPSSHDGGVRVPLSWTQQTLGRNSIVILLLLPKWIFTMWFHIWILYTWLHFLCKINK